MGHNAHDNVKFCNFNMLNTLFMKMKLIIVFFLSIISNVLLSQQKDPALVYLNIDYDKIEVVLLNAGYPLINKQYNSDLGGTMSTFEVKDIQGVAGITLFSKNGIVKSVLYLYQAEWGSHAQLEKTSLNWGYQYTGKSQTSNGIEYVYVNSTNKTVVVYYDNANNQDATGYYDYIFYEPVLKNIQK